MPRYRKLTQEDKEEKDGLSEQLKRKGEALDNATEQFNNEIARLWETVETAINEYNKALKNSKKFVDRIECDRTGRCEFFSQNWWESPKQGTVADWSDKWQEYSNKIEDVALDCPEIDFPSAVASTNEAFDALPPEIKDPDPKEKVLKFQGRRVVGIIRRRV